MLLIFFKRQMFRAKYGQTKTKGIET